MKILFHHRIASRDGQAVHMDELLAALRQLGHEIVVVGPARTARVEFGGESGLIASLKRHLPAALYEILEFGYNFVALPRLWAAVRREKPDAIYERYNLFSIAGATLRRFHEMPLLLEVNAPIFEERLTENGLSLWRFAAWTQRVAWRGADHVLPVTNILADYIRRADVPEHRIAIIPNGIDGDKFGIAPDRDEAKRRLGLAGKLVLGFTGFVRAWNNLDRIIDLLAPLSREHDVHLVIVGDGPVRAALEEQAKRLGVADRLTITGIVPRDAVVAHIAAFDVALQPGVTAYASPLKLFEYMAIGLAIVAPDQPNIREVLTHESDSLLVDPSRPGDLAAAMERLCRDPTLRAKLGAAAHATIERRGFTWIGNARRVLGLIEGNAASVPIKGSVLNSMTSE
jgi:glycosyltransferase involved in cell wall biosynthesis